MFAYLATASSLARQYQASPVRFSIYLLFSPVPDVVTAGRPRPLESSSSGRSAPLLHCFPAKALCATPRATAPKVTPIPFPRPPVSVPLLSAISYVSLRFCWYSLPGSLSGPRSRPCPSASRTRTYLDQRALYFPCRLWIWHRFLFPVMSE